MFGDLMASKLLAVLSSVLIAVPGFWFARYWLRPWPSVLVGLLLSLDVLVTEYAFNGYLVVIALGLTLWAWRELLDILDGRGVTWRLVLAVFLLVGFNQTAPPIFAMLALLSVAAGQERKRAVIALGWAVLASLVWFYPFYSVNIPFGPDMTFSEVPFIALSPVPLYLLYAWPIAALGVYMLSLHWRDRRLWLLLLSALVAIGLSSVGLSDVAWNNVVRRTAYLLPVLAFVLAFYTISRGDRIRIRLKHIAPVCLVAFGVGAILSLALWGYLAQSAMQLTAPRLAAVRWIEQNTARDAYVVAHPRSLAYWVGAVGQRRWEGSWPVPLVGREHEEQARECAMGWRSGCDPLEYRDRYGVDYLVIDTDSYRYVDGEFGRTPVTVAPWLEPLFRAGDVTVYGWRD